MAIGEKSGAVLDYRKKRDKVCPGSRALEIIAGKEKGLRHP
jgi:hypothetical protein